jgi:hypothetical protein
VIVRVWHGWTTPANADAYDRLLREEIFQLLRRMLEHEVEFATVMRFESVDAVRSFAGDDYEAAVVPPAARRLLARFDARSAHYELREIEQEPR